MMKILPSSPTILHAWTDWARSLVDVELNAAEDAQRALIHAPDALFACFGFMPPPVHAVIRVQDAMTRMTYQSLVAWNRVAGIVSDQVCDEFEARARSGD